MPLFKSSDEWHRQSSLLLQARPRTTRITTKYLIPDLESDKYTKKRARNEATRARKAARSTSTTTATETPEAAQPLVPRAYIELKTYDPESGVVLKYKTDKAAEVGRLIATLGRLGRHMAALPEIKEDIPMVDAPAAAAETEVPTTTLQPDVAPTTEAKPPAAGGGGKKKKKTGKK